VHASAGGIHDDRRAGFESAGCIVFAAPRVFHAAAQVVLDLFRDERHVPDGDSFGTNFVLLVDHYQKSIRSAKYGILFIALTFLALLFVEFSTDSKIHVFHYLQLALGLVLFFSLLNALSEQIGFNLAYLAASLSTIALITTFLKGLIRQNKPVLLMTGLLVFLYSFIFILLTLNDYAYLAGNIGLFILLAITMRFSLKLNLKNQS
jgi:inner membrane protein